MSDFLCIGGPCDGQRIHSEKATLEMVAYQTFKLPDDPRASPAGFVSEMQTARYEKRAILEGNDRITFWRPSNISDADALRAVFKAYEQLRKLERG